MRWKMLLNQLWMLVCILKAISDAWTCLCVICNITCVFSLTSLLENFCWFMAVSEDCHLHLERTSLLKNSWPLQEPLTFKWFNQRTKMISDFIFLHYKHLQKLLMTWQTDRQTMLPYCLSVWLIYIITFVSCRDLCSWDILSCVGSSSRALSMQALRFWGSVRACVWSLVLPWLKSLSSLVIICWTWLWLRLFIGFT